MASKDHYTVLVAEDDFLLGEYLSASLAAEGLQVAGPARDVAAAVLVAEESPIDFAVLDVGLGNGSASPVADILRRRRIPFALTTGLSGGALPADLAIEERWEKPFDAAILAQMIRQRLHAANA